MATLGNRKTREFISWRPSIHNDVIAVDFFSVNPNSLRGQILWCFPPKVVATKAATKLINEYADHKWALLIHLFAEVPLGVTPLMNDPKTKLIKLPTNTVWSFLPSERIIDTGQGTFRGKPNARPKATWLFLHNL